MPLTVDACVNEIVGRAGGYMGMAELSVVRDETNPDAVAALGYGYRTLGHVPANGLTPDDIDMQAVPDAQTNALLDLAEYRILATVRNWFVFTRTQVGAGAAYFYTAPAPITTTRPAKKSVRSPAIARFYDVNHDAPPEGRYAHAECEEGRV